MVTPLLFCLCLAQTPPTPAQAPSPTPASADVPAPQPPKPRAAPVTRVDDKGLLEHAYFGAEIPFVSRNGADALWIKEGLSLKGKVIGYGSWDTKVLQVGRQPKDLQRCEDLAKLIPDTLMPQLRAVFQGTAQWELGAMGDYRFEGRVVDANVPNKASKLVFGWLGGKDNLENVTWDMKLVDTLSGETVLAFHHRMVKVNTLGSLDGSLRDWAKDFPKELFTLLK